MVNSHNLSWLYHKRRPYIPHKFNFKFFFSHSFVRFLSDASGTMVGRYVTQYIHHVIALCYMANRLICIFILRNVFQKLFISLHNAFSYICQVLKISLNLIGMLMCAITLRVKFYKILEMLLYELAPFLFFSKAKSAVRRTIFSCCFFIEICSFG